MPGVYDWDYEWAPKYPTYEDMNLAQCGYVGIVEGDDFEENQATQTFTSGNPSEEEQSSGLPSVVLEVDIIGDGSVDHGWEGSVTAETYAGVFFCPSDNIKVWTTAYLEDLGYFNYNLALAYCLGEEGVEGDELLPDIFGEDNDNVTVLPTDGNFLNEFLFSNDDNDDLIGLRIYKNDINDSNPDIQNDFAAYNDSVSPGLWYTEKAVNAGGGYSTTTIGGYQAIEVGTTTYIAASNIPYPNIYLFSYNENAEEEITNVFDQLLDKILINYK